MTNYNYFCKTADENVYGCINADAPSKLQLANKAKWLETTGNLVINLEIDETNKELKDTSIVKFDGTTIILDVAKKAVVIKEAKKKLNEEARRELQFGWMNIGGVATIKNTYDNQILIETGAVKYERYPTDIDTYFPEGIKIKTGSGDNDIMIIPTSVVLSVEKMTSLTVQKMFDSELEVRDVIVADCQAVIDETKTLAEFEATDYVAQFNTIFEAGITDTAVFAQPTEEPV